MFALRELLQTLAEALREALEAADIRRRWAAWWWCCTHRKLLDGPPPSTEQAVRLNGRQLMALELAREQGRVTNGDLQHQFCCHPETLRQDLAGLCNLGYLEKRGQKRGTFYTPGSAGREQR
jgi:hypothetical protein